MKQQKSIESILKKLSGVEKLVHAVTRDDVSPTCLESILLLNNLGTLYHHLTIKVDWDQ